MVKMMVEMVETATKAATKAEEREAKKREKRTTKSEATKPSKGPPKTVNPRILHLHIRSIVVVGWIKIKIIWHYMTFFHILLIFT